MNYDSRLTFGQVERAAQILAAAGFRPTLQQLMKHTIRELVWTIGGSVSRQRRTVAALLRSATSEKA